MKIILTLNSKEHIIALASPFAVGTRASVLPSAGLLNLLEDQALIGHDDSIGGVRVQFMIFELPANL